jgi:pimeloyl-ACP methyl ester carboxylesterase
MRENLTIKLIDACDSFCTKNPEEQHLIDSRTWGVISTGKHGPALVLLPGTLGRGDIFWQQIESLSDRTRILALTYPDSGSIKDWAGDIKMLMRATGMEKATVLGTSLGGYIAQYFSATHRELVTNLVAANTLASVDFLANVPPYNQDLDNVPLEGLRRGFVKALQGDQNESAGQSELVGFLLREVSGRISGSELRARLKALRFAPNLHDQSLSHEHIYCVESADDPIIPEMLRKAVCKQLAPDRIFRFLNGHHFPYLTRPDAYTGLLEEVLGLNNTKPQWPAGRVAEL